MIQGYKNMKRFIILLLIALTAAALFAYPVSITRLYVILNRKALDLNEMKPVSPIVRLSNIGAF